MKEIFSMIAPAKKKKEITDIVVSTEYESGSSINQYLMFPCSGPSRTWK